MSKYIIEIKPEYEDSFKGLMILGTKDSNLFVDTLAVENLEELTSDYINEHFSDLQDTAYQRGLNDAWEAARKIVEMWEKIDNDDLLEIFGLTAKIGESTVGTLFGKQTASEAIAKLEKQKADDKIEVGDEVRLCRHKVPYIVTSCDGDDDAYILMTVNGGFIKAEKYNVRKTGRHFDIQSILEAMKND